MRYLILLLLLLTSCAYYNDDIEVGVEIYGGDRNTIINVHNDEVSFNSLIWVDLQTDIYRMTNDDDVYDTVWITIKGLHTEDYITIDGWVTRRVIMSNGQVY